jgi:type III secretory pathway component EscS
MYLAKSARLREIIGKEAIVAEDSRRIYGRAAQSALPLSGSRFAIWTVACDTLVFGGSHYSALIWALLIITVLTGIGASYFFGAVVGAYAATSDAFDVGAQFTLPLVAALVTAILIAPWTTNPLPYFGRPLSQRS